MTGHDIGKLKGCAETAGGRSPLCQPSALPKAMLWGGLVLVLAIVAGWLATQTIDHAKVQEEKLGAIEAHPTSLVVSDDGCHLAYVMNRGPKNFWVVDGQAGPEYDSVGERGLVFSSDGKRAAYFARSGDSHFVVVDGQPGPEYDAIGQDPPIFSPDGKRVAYAVKKADKWLLVVDGQPGPECDAIQGKDHTLRPGGKGLAEFGGPVFSPDSRRLAYLAKIGGKLHVVLDGQVGPECDAIEMEPFRFTSDGELLRPEGGSSSAQMASAWHTNECNKYMAFC